MAREIKKMALNFMFDQFLPELMTDSSFLHSFIFNVAKMVKFDISPFTETLPEPHLATYNRTPLSAEIRIS